MITRSTRCFRIALFACLVAGALAPGAANAKTVKLTYSIFLPPTHIQTQLAEAWCKEVAQRTQGRVQVQFFPGQNPYQGQSDL